MNICITAIIKSKPEFTAEVRSVLETMVEHTRNEEACIQYDLHQGVDEENLFVFYEIWADQSGLDRHNEQPCIKAFRELEEKQLEEKPTVYLTRRV